MAKKPAKKTKKLADGGETKKGFYADANAQLARAVTPPVYNEPSNMSQAYAAAGNPLSGALSGAGDTALAFGRSIGNGINALGAGIGAVGSALLKDNLTGTEFDSRRTVAAQEEADREARMGKAMGGFSGSEADADAIRRKVMPGYGAAPAAPPAAQQGALPAPQPAEPQQAQARSPYLDEQAPYGRVGDQRPQGGNRMMGEVDAMLQKMRDMGASQDNIDTMTRRLGKYMMAVGQANYGHENQLANTALHNQGQQDVAHTKGGYGVLDRSMATQGALDLDVQKGTREEALKRDIASTQADTAKYEALARTYPQMAPYINKPNDPRAAMYLQRLFAQQPAGRADGGVIGMAAGGAVPAALDPGMEGMTTMPGEFSLPSAQQNEATINKWKAYAQAALANKVMPVDLITFQKMAAPMQATMASGTRGLGVGPGASPTMLARGGQVPAMPVAGREVVDPDHGGQVDSIPAVIDGEQPAALNSGEVVIPSDVVRALGTEYFDKLIAKYHKNTQPTAVG